MIVTRDNGNQYIFTVTGQVYVAAINPLTEQVQVIDLTGVKLDEWEQEMFEKHVPDNHEQLQAECMSAGYFNREQIEEGSETFNEKMDRLYGRCEHCDNLSINCECDMPEDEGHVRLNNWE